MFKQDNYTDFVDTITLSHLHSDKSGSLNVMNIFDKELTKLEFKAPASDDEWTNEITPEHYKDTYCDHYDTLKKASDIYVKILLMIRNSIEVSREQVESLINLIVRINSNFDSFVKSEGAKKGKQIQAEATKPEIDRMRTLAAEKWDKNKKASKNAVSISIKEKDKFDYSVRHISDIIKDLDPKPNNYPKNRKPRK
jgi:hypothetical protein